MLMKVVLVSLIVPAVLTYTINNNIYDPDEYQKLKDKQDNFEAETRITHTKYHQHQSKNYETFAEINITSPIAEANIFRIKCKTGFLPVGNKCFPIVSTI